VIDYHASIQGAVSMNGLLVPTPGDFTSEYDSASGHVDLGRFNLKAGDYVLGHVDLGFDEPEFGVNAHHDIGEFDLGGASTLGGLGIKGKVGLTLVHHASRLTLQLGLPDIFSMGNRPAQGEVKFLIDNGGVHLDGAHLEAPTLFLGPLEVDNFFLDYQSNGDVWNGGADLKLAIGSPFALHARPPPPDNGVGFKGGEFDHAGATLEFAPESAPQLFPGIFLTQIGFSLGVHPTRFRGSIQLKALQILQIDGQLFLVLASPDEPYTFPAEGAGEELKPAVGRTFESTAFAAGGAASLSTPVGNLPLAHAFVLYEYPSYFEFEGGIGIHIAVVDIDGGVGGWIDIDKGKFNVEGHVDACVVHLACIGVVAVVSSRGIAGCGSIKVIFARVSAGFGYRWGDGVHIMIGTCDVGPYREQRAAVHSASNTTSFTVKGGLPNEMLEVTGAGDGPRFTLHGPHGEKYAMGSDRSRIEKNFGFVRESENDTTYFGIFKPSAGTWTLTLDSGSPSIKSFRQADGLRAPNIHGHVSGHGAVRTLHYRVAPRPGEQVTFAEQGKDAYSEIGRATGSHGKLRFKPSFGVGGRRNIVALVRSNGVVAHRIVVTTFKVPRPRKPARPRGLHVKRKGKVLKVRWKRAKRAKAYAVILETSDGARTMRVTRKRKITFKGVRKPLHGSVSVSGLRIDNAFGRASHARFKRVRKHHRHRRHHRHR